MFDVITSWMAAWGSVAVALLMFLENAFPPIPSEIVMPFAGYLAAQGKMDLIAVVVMGTIGSVAGACLWYWVGLLTSERRLRGWIDRHGRWLTLSLEDFDRSLAWFSRHGGAAVFFGRMLPGIRTLISVPAGMTRMPFLPFLGYTALGSLIWTAGLTLAGYLLRAQFDRVATWLNPVTNVLLLALLGIYIWRVARTFLRG